LSVGVVTAQEPSAPRDEDVPDEAAAAAEDAGAEVEGDSVIPPPPPDPVPSVDDEPPHDLEGWRWMGTTSGLLAGVAITSISLPLLLNQTDGMRELTSGEVAGNVLLSVSSFLLTGGLTIGGYFLFPALAEEGDWDGGVGYDIALAEIFGVVCAALAVSIASVAGGDELALGISAASAGVGGIVLGAISGVALDDDGGYDDRRLLPLFGTTSLTLLTLLTTVLVAGIGGFDDPWDEVMLVTSGVGVASGVTMVALAASR
jgi:hypothetical protein